MKLNRTFLNFVAGTGLLTVGGLAGHDIGKADVEQAVKTVKDEAKKEKRELIDTNLEQRRLLHMYTATIRKMDADLKKNKNKGILVHEAREKN